MWWGGESRVLQHNALRERDGLTHALDAVVGCFLCFLTEFFYHVNVPFVSFMNVAIGICEAPVRSVGLGIKWRVSEAQIELVSTRIVDRIYAHVET